MRGKSLHNHIVAQTAGLLRLLGWIVFFEYLLCRNGITNYLDILGIHSGFQMAFEIESTPRHVIDNCRKAEVIRVPICIIVPTKQVYQSACKQVKSLDITPGGYPIRIFMFHQLEQGFMTYLPLIIAANRQTDK